MSFLYPLSVALLVIMVFMLIVPASVGAQPGINCDAGFGKNQVEGVHDGQWTPGPGNDNHQGIRGDLWIGSASNDCSRVSSYGVLHGTNGVVEWGWILGYIWDDSLGGSCPDGTEYFDEPTRFVVWVPNGGGTHCRIESGLVSGHFRNFSLKDHNQDTEWTYSFEGTSNGTMNVNFSRGVAVTNGERHKATDSAYAEFDHLELQLSGGTPWYTFDVEQYVDEDDDYNCIRQSADFQQVRTQNRTCPLP